MRRRGAVRMGSLNILVLVVALCLAVLAVLSLSTAQAAVGLSERQSESVRQSYAAEDAAQAFLAAVDSQLYAARAAGASPEGIMRSLDAVLSGAGESASAEGEGGIADARQKHGITAQARLLDLQQLSAAVRADTSSLNLIGGISATFATAGGQQLSCLLGITEDAAYQILSWESEKIWEEGAQSERLWQGLS